MESIATDFFKINGLCLHFKTFFTVFSLHQTAIRPQIQLSEPCLSACQSCFEHNTKYIRLGRVSDLTLHPSPIQTALDLENVRFVLDPCSCWHSSLGTGIQSTTFATTLHFWMQPCAKGSGNPEQNSASNLRIWAQLWSGLLH